MSAQLPNLYEDYISEKGWNTFFTHTSFEARMFTNEFKNNPLNDRMLLDIGFGNGAFLSWAKKVGAQVHGIEIQPDLINSAKQESIVVFEDITKVDSDYIDVLTGFDFIEHISIEHIPNFITHFYRVLKKDGELLLRFPNCQSPAGLASHFGDHTHLSMLSGPVIRHYLLQAGFKDVTIRPSAELPNASLIIRIAKALLKPMTALFELLYRVHWSIRTAPLSSNVTVTAKK